MTHVKRIISSVLCMAFIIVMLLPVCASAAYSDYEHSGDTVKVAYPVSQISENMDQKPKSGAYYEYLQKLSAFTGWKYEYVYGTYSELISGIENGEIDIMGNVALDQELLDKVDYGTNAQGTEKYYLVTKIRNDSLDKYDVSTLSGKKIGVCSDKYVVNMVNEWVEERNISNVSITEYSSLDEIYKGIDLGNIDAFITDEIIDETRFTSLYHVGSIPYYFVTSKSDPWLNEELDRAQGEILKDDPNYNETLEQKYGSSSDETSTSLSKTEEQWLLERRNVVVGYIKNFLPYSDMSIDGNIDGMYKDFFTRLMEQFGISFIYMGYDSYESLLDAVDNGEVDVIAPVYFDYWTAENHGLLLADMQSESSITIISRKESEEDTLEKIAVCDACPEQIDFAMANYPDAYLVYCESFDSCLYAVKEGIADATIKDTENLNIIKDDYKSIDDLKCITLNTTISYSVAVRTDNTELLSIINKGNAFVPEHELNRSVARYSLSYENNNESGFLGFIKENSVVLFVIATMLFILMIGIIISMKVRTRAAQGKAQKAFDDLTSENEKINTFLSETSRDMRTTINGIMGTLTMIERNRKNEKKVDGFLQTIKDEAKQLLIVVNSIHGINEIDKDIDPKVEEEINKDVAELLVKPEENGESLNGVKILLAEDNELNMEIANFILKEAGAEVTTAENGKQALDAFRTNPEGTFDVVLMDIMMPVMDGLEATRSIRLLSREDADKIPIIAMTANAFEEDERKSKEAGMNAHLLKPLDNDKLISTIKQFVNKN